MPKSRVDTPSQGKVTASHLKGAARHIRLKESDGPDMALAARIRELIGDDANTSFASACGFSEGMLRKYLKGAQPRPQFLANMAEHRNVNIQWLATGTGPKPRQYSIAQSIGPGHVAAQYMKGIDDVPNGKVNDDLLSRCMLACYQVHGDNFPKALMTVQVRYAADFYNQLVALTNAKSPPANLGDFCRLDSDAMAEQLRCFLKMGWARNFPAEISDNGRDAYSW